MRSHVEVVWFDHGREPVCPPKPGFPFGVDVDPTSPGEAGCKVDLPYPAPRCGHYRIACTLCGYGMILTTAGRRDDPRSVTLPCRKRSPTPENKNDE